MINLLPQKQKQELLEEEKLKLVLILEIVILGFLICLALILFPIKFQIQGQIDSQKILVNSKKKELSEIKPLEEKLQLINQELSKLNSFYQGQFSLTQFLERISGIIPEGIYLDSFSYRENTSQITLSGYAPTVKVLVDFENNLAKQKDFKKIYFSPATWMKLIDINFNTTFKIEP